MTPTHARRHVAPVPFYWLLASGFWLLPPAQAAPPATAPDRPRAVAEKIVSGVLTVLRDPKLSKPEKGQKVQQIAQDNMDFTTLARLSLGAPWRKITDDQRARFTEEFRKHVINTYRHTTDDYTDEDIQVTADRIESDGDATVLTRITGTKDNGARGEVAKVDYRLRQKDGQWKIIDVIIDGISLVSNFRSQFQEIITNGNVDKLIQLLHDKNADAEKNQGK